MVMARPMPLFESSVKHTMLGYIAVTDDRTKSVLALSTARCTMFTSWQLGNKLLLKLSHSSIV